MSSVAVRGSALSRGEADMSTRPLGMYGLLRAVIFKLDPEIAHNLAIRMCWLVGATPISRALAYGLFCRGSKCNPVTAFGLHFANRIGLAAGYDKGLGLWGLAALGFGHIEEGTFTTKLQKGSDGRRLFRDPDGTVVNRMGFPNPGVDVALSRIQRRPKPGGLVLGINIGKHRDTPLDAAVGDYCELLWRFAPVADYITVNVSSPNTLGLRDLQVKGRLEVLLGALVVERPLLEASLGRKLPMLVKLSPDQPDQELDDALSVIISKGMDGVIASNTSLQRPPWLGSSAVAKEKGGLSGRHLKPLSIAMVRKVVSMTDGVLPVIGCGGISSPEVVKEFLGEGAVLVQVLTVLAFGGPGVVRSLVRGSI